MLKSDFLQRLTDTVKALYDYSLVPDCFSKDEKIPLICKKCNRTFSRIASSQLHGATCPYCGLRKRHTTESFIKYAKQIYGMQYGYTKTVYKASREKVTITCNRCSKDFETTANNFLRGRGCPHCRAERLSEKFRQPKEEFIKRAREIHGDKYDYSKVVYKNNRTPVTIVCNTCGSECAVLPSNHLRGKGCKKCGYIKQVSSVIDKHEKLFLTKAKELYNDRYDYSHDKYLNSEKKIKILCKKHNIFFKQTPVGHLHSSGCPLCKPVSKGEEVIKDILTKKNVVFEQQKVFEKCKDKRLLPFDFYLPNYNLCIEYQGQQHYGIVEFFGGEKEFKIRQKHDKIKRNFCKKNKIVLLEIKYSDNIESKLNEFLLNKQKESK